jgi:lipopolysaccharide export LptBFGC system permease protein LptF
MNQADSENQTPPSIGTPFEEPMVKFVDMSKFTVDDDIFYEYDVDPFLQWRIDAEKVRWDDELEQWIIYNGVKRTWDFRGRLLSLEYMDNQALPELTERPFHFINTDKKVERMTLEECQLQIYKLMRSHKRYKKQEVEMYSRKIAFQFSTFVVVLVGLTLGRFHSRKSVLIRSFIMALIVFFLYFILYQLGESIGKKTTLPSYLTPHLGNIAYVLMSIVLMKRSQT